MSGPATFADSDHDRFTGWLRDRAAPAWLAPCSTSERTVRQEGDLEHGKPTVQLREVLCVLDALGLTLRVQPR